MIGMFYICVVQCGNHWPQVAMGPMQCGRRDWESKLLILFNLDSFKCKLQHILAYSSTV